MPLRKIKLERDTEPDPQQSKQLDLERPTANAIYDQALRNGRRELERPAIALAISGVVGGLTMGLTGLSVSVVQGRLGPQRGPSSSRCCFIQWVFWPSFWDAASCLQKTLSTRWR